MLLVELIWKVFGQLHEMTEDDMWGRQLPLVPELEDEYGEAKEEEDLPLDEQPDIMTWASTTVPALLELVGGVVPEASAAPRLAPPEPGEPDVERPTVRVPKNGGRVKIE